MVNGPASFIDLILMLEGRSLGVERVIHGQGEWQRMAGYVQEFSTKLLGK